MKLVTLENDPDNPRSMAAMLRQAGYHCRGYGTPHALVDSPWVVEADLAIVDTDAMKLDKRLISYLAEIFWPEQKMLLVGSDERRLSQMIRDKDGFLLKPVSARGLAASVKTMLSKTWDGYAIATTTRFGRYVFEPAGETHGRSVLVGEARVPLTQKEYQLALILFRNLSRPVSRVYLAGAVWRHDERINARTMTAHVSAIRSKLQLRDDADFVLTPIYNYGYRLDPVSPHQMQSQQPRTPTLVPAEASL
jgi:DNA-binding response OmpR family regulator